MMDLRCGRVFAATLVPAAYLALSCLPAEAAQCPSGQFYRASQRTCVPKAEAVKLGFTHGDTGKSSAPSVKKVAAKPAEKPVEVAKSDPPAMGGPMVEPAAAPPPPPEPERRSFFASPFGALVPFIRSGTLSFGLN